MIVGRTPLGVGRPMMLRVNGDAAALVPDGWQRADVVEHLRPLMRDDDELRDLVLALERQALGG